MRINPAGIQVYQQQTEADRLQRLNKDQAKVKESELAAPAQPKEVEQSLSQVGVKAGSNISREMLSDEERAALDMLFARFQNNSRFQSVRQGVSPESDARPGQVIDIKV